MIQSIRTGVVHNSMPKNATFLQLNKLRFHGLTIWSAIVLLQSTWWLSWENQISALLTLAGGILGVSVFLRKDYLREFPISTSMLLGYTTYYFLLPPVATAIEWKPLTHNLDHPVLVLVHAVVCLLFLLAAHIFYRNAPPMQSLRMMIVERVYRPLHFFRAPGNLHLLAMGIIGLLAMSYQIFIAGTVQQEALGTGNKFMQGMFPLAYLPYAILVKPAMGSDVRLSRKWLLIIAYYTVLLVLVSIGYNRRETFLLGMMSIAMVYAYGLAIQLFSSARLFIGRNVVIAIFCIWFVSGPVADFATSMVIVRNQRTDVSPIQLMDKTLTAFQDKDAIRARRIKDKKKSAYSATYSNYYVDNLFLARMANLKFPDISLGLAISLNSIGKEYLRKVEWQRLLSVLPRPIIKILGLSVDKGFTTSCSGGDLLLYAATGSPNALGTFRTGSIFASGYVIFGWFYPFVLALLAIFLFAFADAQTSRRQLPSQAGKPEWVPIFSPMAIVTFFSWFFYLTCAATGIESMSELTRFMLRGWLQVLLIYAVAYWSTYVVLKPFVKG